MTEVKKALPVDHKTIGTQRVTRFKTQFNAIPDPGNPLPGELPSMTIPNEAMTVREIIAMQARGLTLNNRRVPVYNGEEDIPDFQHLDLADQEAIMQTNQALITEMQKTLKDQEKAYVDAKRKKRTGGNRGKDRTQTTQSLRRSQANEQPGHRITSKRKGGQRWKVKSLVPGTTRNPS